MTLKTVTGSDDYGEKTYSSETALARFLNTSNRRYDGSVMVVEHGQTCLFLEPDTLPIASSVIVYNDREYKISRIEECLDSRNERYQWQLAIQ